MHIEKAEKKLEFSSEYNLYDESKIKELTKEEITVELLEAIAENSFKLKALHAQVKKEQTVLNSLKEEQLGYLKHLMDVLDLGSSYRSKYGTVSVSEVPNYRLPQDDESRAKFFGYLKDKGVYDSMINVNSKTLQSFVKQEIDLAEDEGNFDFLPDGIEETEYRTKFSLRK